MLILVFFNFVLSQGEEMGMQLSTKWENEYKKSTTDLERDSIANKWLGARTWELHMGWRFSDKRRRDNAVASAKKVFFEPREYHQV